MAFLTIFTAPKPFTKPHINIIQRNAINSWKRLEDVEVIVIGDEPGIPEAAKELGAVHVPSVRRDKDGIPLVDSIMEIGHENSQSPLLVYANADMILMSDLVRAARNVAAQEKEFLLVGQRWNLDITELLDFSSGWERRLRDEVKRRGKLYTSWGIDYFIFPRGLYTQVPNFTIGRPAWDNWMIYHARKTFGMAIDGTLDILAVHQNHDYSHLPGNQAPYHLEVAQSNRAKAGGRKCIYNTLDTNRELVDGRIRRPKFRLVRLLRSLEHVFINNRGKGWSWEIALRLQRMQRSLDIKPRS